MKKFSCTLIILLIFQTNTLCQLFFEENFSYPTGGLITVSGGKWINFSSVTPDISVVEGNLAYPGYPSSGIGNMIFSDASDQLSVGAMRSFSTTLNQTIYASFLIMIKDTADLDPNGSYFFSFLNSEFMRKAYIFIKSTDPGYVRLGTGKSAPGTFVNIDYPVMTPLLIVLKFKMNSPDSLKLWINPPLSATEPAPQVSLGSYSTTNTKAVCFFSQSKSGNLYIDGARFSTRWEDAPLPVSLSSFTAAHGSNLINLTWRTETEQDNYGFDIERKISTKIYAEDWKKIGFTPGAGNSNIPHDYYFSDTEIAADGIYYYRLKQIDNNGNFVCSQEIQVSITSPGELMLQQNFPNPFNPVTNITFSLPADDYITVRVYNIIGQQKAELLSSYKSAGFHKLEFNSADLSSGTYFCELLTSYGRKLIKMIIKK